MEGIKIKLLPNKFLKEDNTFNLKDALLLSGKIGGMCYLQGDFASIENEDQSKTIRRIVNTIENRHHSVYDHIYLNLEIEGLPKLLAMILNNEKMYTTSEKSARYTHIDESTGVSLKEIALYNKWDTILTEQISKMYSKDFDEKRIKKLAQENARYMVSLFMPTKMAYSTSLRQINYIYHWFEEYILNASSDLEHKIANSLKEFNTELIKNNLIIRDLKDTFDSVHEGITLSDGKNRTISLFANSFDDEEEIYSNVYNIVYMGSGAYLAQAQRHRTINYQMILENTHKFYVPEIIKDNPSLVDEWNKDMESVSDLLPQGMLFKIRENGTYDDFILKCKERLCTFAQLEINDLSSHILNEYAKHLDKKGHPLMKDIKSYLKGARCTFPCYKCDSPCHFIEGVKLIRKI